MDELTWRARGRLWLRLALRIILTLAGVILFFKVALPLFSLLMPFVLGLVVAWIFNRPIRYLQKKWGAPRGVLSLGLLLLSFAVVGGVLVGFAYTMVGQVRSFFLNWESNWNAIMGAINAATGTVEGWFEPLPPNIYQQAVNLLDAFVGWLGDVVPNLLGSGAAKLGSVAMSLPAFVISTVIFIMAAYFISADYPRLRYGATSRLPEELRRFLGKVKDTAVAAFGGYVKAQLILSFIIFWILLAGFFITGQSYALLLALFLAILDFIPIIGSGTVMVPWAVIDLVLKDYRHALELMVIWGVVAVFRRVGEPKVVGDQTGLSPIASLLSIYVGMRLAGVGGMILGPVVCMVILTILRSGTFDPVLADMRMAARDISALFRNGRREAAPPEEETAVQTPSPEEGPGETPPFNGG